MAFHIMQNLLKNSIGHLAVIVLICLNFAHNRIVAQASTINPLNGIDNVNDFLGWDNTINSDLLIRHNEIDQPIIFRIGGVEHMRYTTDASLAVNTTVSDGAIVNILQDQTGNAISCTVFNQDGNANNFGIRTSVSANSPINIGTHALVPFSNSGSGVDIAVYGLMTSTNALPSLKCGVFGTTDNLTLGNPPNWDPGDWAAVFIGDVQILNGMYLPSDGTLKMNTELYDGAREVLNALRPVSFEFIPNDRINFPEGLHYGFIAQEVQEVLPHLVS